MTDTLSPLTEKDFESGLVYGGHHLNEDEWGSTVTAYGHIPAAEFAAAVNAYDLELADEDSGYSAVDVEHIWLVLTERDEGGEWAARVSDADIDGAVPATMVLR